MNGIAGEDAERAFPHPCQGADISGGHLVGHHGIDDRLFHCGEIIRAGQSQDLSGIDKTLHVFLQAEHGGSAVGTRIGADAFKIARSVMQGVRKHMDFGFFRRDEPAVKPDVRGEFQAGHSISPCENPKISRRSRKWEEKRYVRRHRRSSPESLSPCCRTGVILLNFKPGGGFTEIHFFRIISAVPRVPCGKPPNPPQPESPCPQSCRALVRRALRQPPREFSFLPSS